MRVSLYAAQYIEHTYSTNVYQMKTFAQKNEHGINLRIYHLYHF